eukprot:366042-Chlamydomonas_euryale.AAC.5
MSMYTRTTGNVSGEGPRIAGVRMCACAHAGVEAFPSRVWACSTPAVATATAATATVARSPPVLAQVGVRELHAEHTYGRCACQPRLPRVLATAVLHARVELVDDGRKWKRRDGAARNGMGSALQERKRQRKTHGVSVQAEELSHMRKKGRTCGRAVAQA